VRGRETPAVWDPLERANIDLAVAQAVSRWRLSTAAARVRFQVRSCGIYGEQGGAGTGILRFIIIHHPGLVQ
jgi:hypothetical protein